MSDDRIALWEVSLDPTHQRTGRTRHFQGQDLLPAAAKLHIERYPEAQGVYLIYLDAEAEEITDTYHDTLSGAMAQAEWEYLVRKKDWKPCAGGPR